MHVVEKKWRVTSAGKGAYVLVARAALVFFRELGSVSGVYRVDQRLPLLWKGLPAKRMPSHRVSVALVALFVAWSAPGRYADAQPFVVERIMGTWEPVPGAEQFTWNSLGNAPQIDASGGVSFLGTWQDGGGPFGAKVAHFYGTPGEVSPSGVVFTPAPQAPWPAPYNLFNYVGGSPANTLAESGFFALRYGIGNMSFFTPAAGALYAGVPTAPSLAAYYGPPEGPTPGPPAPGAPDQITVGISKPLANSVGQVAYRSTLYPTGSSPLFYNAITAGSPDSLSLVAAAGQPVSSVPGASYTSVGDGGFSLSDGGHVGFYATFAGPSITPESGFAYLRWLNGDVDVVARATQQAPGLAPGVTFAGFGFGPGISATGSVEFTASVFGPGIDADNNWGVWTGQPGQLTPALREGDTTGGLDSGVEAAGFGFATINDQDVLAIEGYVRGAGIDSFNDQVVWLGPAGSLEAVFREGDQAPGLPDGVVFAFDAAYTDSFLTFPERALNDEGDLLIAAALAGPGVTPANNAGIWFRDGATGLWSLIVRTGTMLDGRVLASESDSNLSAAFLDSFDAGHSQSLVDDGSFALKVKFTDGEEGIYRFSVPEPTFAGLALAIFSLGALRPHTRARLSASRKEFRTNELESIPVHDGRRPAHVGRIHDGTEPVGWQRKSTG